ncbi:MAG: hypothetical protein ACP5NV_00530 [Candidatus Woesearchaeota archaeon]
MTIAETQKTILELTDKLNTESDAAKKVNSRITQLNDELSIAKTLLWIKKGINLGNKENSLQLLSQYIDQKHNAISSLLHSSGSFDNDTICFDDFIDLNDVLKNLDFSDNDTTYVRGTQFSNYAQAVDALRNIPISKDYVMPVFMKSDGSLIYRPHTMKELYEIKLEDFFTLKDANGNTRSDDNRLRFWKTWFSTCSGVLSNDSRYIMIVPESEDLILMDKMDKKNSNLTLPVGFDTIDGIKINYNKKFFNRGLTLNEALSFEGFLAIFGDNDYGRSIIKNSHEIISTFFNDSRMGLSIGNDTTGLRALRSGGDPYIYSYTLNFNACFLAGSPKNSTGNISNIDDDKVYYK